MIRNLQNLEIAVTRLARHGVPYAIRFTLNAAARETRREYRKNLESELTLRNRWTLGSLRNEDVESLDIRTMQARAGSVSPYLATQEFGGAVHGAAGGAKPIPTAAASGEASIKRSKAVPARYHMRNIRFQETSSKASTNRSVRNFDKIRQASKTGKRLVYLDTGVTKGIYRVSGSGTRLRIEMLYNLNQTSVSIDATPLLEPAKNRAKKNMLANYEKALKFQLARHKK